MVRFTIENKHTYKNVDSTIDGNPLAPNQTSVRQEQTVFRYYAPAYPIQGDDDNDRIGKKIMTTSIVSEGFLELRTGNAQNTLGDVYDGFISELIQVGGWGQNYEVNPMNWPLDISVRHMFVEFDRTLLGPEVSQALSPQNLRDWFRSLFVQTGTDVMPSNRMEVLRESTDDTGKFKILYDKVHHLSFDHPQIHYKVNIPYKRTLNFGTTDVMSSPTNHSLIYEIFIGPTNIYTDYGSRAFGDHLLATSAAEANFMPRLIHISHMIKMNYVDF